MISTIFRLGASGVIFLAALFGQTIPAKMGTGSVQAKAAPLLAGFPFTNESLSYNVNWPSGLSMGEGHLAATRDGAGWRFAFSLDAGIPGYAVKDTYRSTASLGLCSASLSKESQHGSKKNSETEEIDKAAGTVIRKSGNGGPASPSNGVSKISVPDCVRDALTLIFFARQELGQGRVPVAQEAIFGATYFVNFSYTGAETVKVNDKGILTDKVVIHVKGPASDFQFDAWFDRDAARTPVAIRVPLPVGKISLELVR